MNSTVLTTQAVTPKVFSLYKDMATTKKDVHVSLYLPRRIEKLAKKSILYSFWVVFTQPLN